MTFLRPELRGASSRRPRPSDPEWPAASSSCCSPTTPYRRRAPRGWRASLRALPDASVDLVVSNYAIHNFDHRYRRELFAEILRVLEPGGLFVNGDRFALNDHDLQLASTRADLRNWFKVFGEAKRYVLLEDWIVHLFSDESADCLMHSSATLFWPRRLAFAARA